MYEKAKTLIESAQKIMVIQAENPDGDSLGSAMALEEILSDLGKDVHLYCDVEMPKYLRYVNGWDRVTQDFDTKADLAIIVDTTSDTLISKAMQIPGARHFFESHPVLVIDHHTETAVTLTFDHELLAEEAVATSEIIHKLAAQSSWKISTQAAEDMMIAIMSDSLGLSTQNVTASTFHTVGELVTLGAHNSVIEERRREFMKKAPEILAYKGRLLERIEYSLDGQLATVHIPWDEIAEFSDQYNPSVLVLDEMRLVIGVKIAIAFKTYPDGKLTGKIRSNYPIAEQVAGFFGGGGHKYAAGFRVFESYDKIMTELITATNKAITNYESSVSQSTHA
jgi:phosphoesterase RecJ-like protein